jgi:Protein of unknown function (DUF1592)/Protein of unknown function (DUF1588)/Protein of unknown function (DUF1587)/Protein of unknown function (DUF1585)/Protein of unknown function (DUF1595)/Planctomycete cytochrome C
MHRIKPFVWIALCGCPLLFLRGPRSMAEKAQSKRAANLSAEYAGSVRPLLVKYCLGCHSTKAKKGELDLQRFTSLAAARKDVKPWKLLIEQLEAGEMPPKGKPQPTAAERKRLISWAKRFLAAEARARAGDPGRVPLHRLNNAEYDNTVRDLTGVDLHPTAEFPMDGAAGEGFTNAAEALNMTPAMMEKYLAASKKIASHVVLLPDGFRFSPRNTRRDWTNESVAKLRAFYRRYTTDGRIPLAAYFTALVRHRADLQTGKTSLEAVAKRDKLSPKYLRILWQASNGKDASFPLDRVRERFNTGTERDVPAIVAEIQSWRDPLWAFQKIGSYRYGATVRAVPKDPAVAASRLFRLKLKPEPGQRDVVLYLAAREFGGDGKGTVVWQRPRFEAAGQPALPLRDYAKYGSQYEIDYAVLFGKTSKYLAAVREAAHDPKSTTKQLANKHGLDERWLKRWIEVVSLKPGKSDEPGRVVPPIELTMLDQKVPQVGQRPAINGWIAKGAGLPILVSNSSDKTERIPGRVSPHHIAVHPMPAEFVAAVWKSPVAGKVRIAAKIAHAHNACGNGVAWWIEKQSPKRSAVLAQGTVDRGKTGSAKPFDLTVQRGDRVFLAIDARDGSHVCDMTEIGFTITETAKPNRKWDLAADVADTVLAGNPHADRHGNKDVWSFVKGPIKDRSQKSGAGIPDGSLLARWRKAAANPAQRKSAEKLAAQVQSLLVGKRPAKKNDPDRILYDNLVSLNGLLLQGFDQSRLSLRERAPRSQPKRPQPTSYGLPQSRFARNSDLNAPLNKVIEVCLPAALFQDHAFVVEAKPSSGAKERVVQFHAATTRPGNAFDPKSPIVSTPKGSGHQRLLDGLAEFRRLFPPFICFPHIIPTDEVVCLKTFHREDEPLIRLFLDKQQTAAINRLWAEQRFISKSPIVENDYLPLFIGFVTQDQPKKLLRYFEGRRGWFRERAERFQREFDEAAPKQMQQLFDFASRAFRRPLRKAEQDRLYALYDALRKKKPPVKATRTLPASGSLDRMSHEEAFRNVLARVLISPSFLLHVEDPPPGKKPRPVNDWELAARLSYFLWGSIPDAELRRAAAAGKLHDPKELARQTRRMLKDDKVRGLAIEFGTQSIHVRHFDTFNEKNEKLFPTFDAGLRKAIYEESILFFQDLFQHNRPVTDLLDSDGTYLNEALAKHYAVPGVTGAKFRRVTGVRKYGRGGILGLASVQAKQAGASRTSPVLRGNWVVETLLGERLPRPPPNVPRLPEKETGNGGLTMRQLVEKHVSVASCAKCHRRIDPFGFAFERFDPIGRRRDKDLGGLPVDTAVTLRDGTKFTGLDGLRTYLLTKKRDVVLRLFCRRLLGYALGRSVTLSDEPLLDEIMTNMKNNDGRLVNVVLAIVKSPQFRMIRGSEFAEEER